MSIFRFVAALLLVIIGVVLAIVTRELILTVLGIALAVVGVSMILVLLISKRKKAR